MTTPAVHRMAMRAIHTRVGATVAFPLAGPSRLARAPTLTRSISGHIQSRARTSILASQTSRSAPIPLPTSPHALTRYRPYSSAPSAQSTNPNARTKSQPDPDPSPEFESEEGEEPVPPNTSAYARLKIMSKKYGWWALGMYLALSTVDFSLCFLAVHALGADRISPLFDSAVGFYREKRYGQEEALRLKEQDEKEREEKRLLEKKEEKKKNSKVTFGATFWTEVALAYAIHKTALLPVRAGLTVAWTPKLVGWLTRRGWVGKGGLTRAATHAQGKVRDASDRVKERVKRTPADKV